MQINTYAVGFELTPSLRGLVESRLLEALRSFSPHIQSAVVHLAAMADATRQSEQVAKSSSAFVRPARIACAPRMPQMQASIDRAIRAIRSAVEREVSKPASASPAASRRARDR